MKNLTDEQLMLLINKGDLKLMQLLFDRYNVRLFNYCLKLTKNRVASEDIMQETFYKVIRHRQSFKNKTFSAWVFTITRNLCYDYLKKTKTNQLQTESLSDDSEHNLKEDNQTKERIKQLNKALDQLDAFDRELIVLSRYQRMKYKEIAEVLDASESAIKTRMHRALQKLKTYYFNPN